MLNEQQRAELREAETCVAANPMSIEEETPTAQTPPACKACGGTGDKPIIKVILTLRGTQEHLRKLSLAAHRCTTSTNKWALGVLLAEAEKIVNGEGQQ
jgi:hypothetical protein